MTPPDRDEVTAACHEVLRGHVPDHQLEAVAASCPSIEHAHRAVEEAERLRLRQHDRRRR